VVRTNQLKRKFLPVNRGRGQTDLSKKGKKLNRGAFFQGTRVIHYSVKYAAKRERRGPQLMMSTTGEELQADNGEEWDKGGECLTNAIRFKRR